MNRKSTTALLAASILVGGEMALQHSDSLVPPDHLHAETRTESVATTATAAFGGKEAAFDNEAFSPALPWARWWTDESQMAAAQGMLRLGE